MLVDFLIFCKTDRGLFGFVVALQKKYIVVQFNNSYVEVIIITIKMVEIYFTISYSDDILPI